MGVHNSDDETWDSDDFYTIVSDDESFVPVTIWGKDPIWVKENNKRSNEFADLDKNMQHSEKYESTVDLECSTCLEKIKSSNLVSVDGYSHTFCYPCIKTWSEKKNPFPCCRMEYYLVICVEK